MYLHLSMDINDVWISRVQVYCILKKNSHSLKYERQRTEDKSWSDRGQESEEQRTGTRGAKDRNNEIEPQIGDTGTADRGRRKEKGRKGTGHVRQGTEDRRQGAEPQDRG